MGIEPKSESWEAIEGPGFPPRGTTTLRSWVFNNHWGTGVAQVAYLR